MDDTFELLNLPKGATNVAETSFNKYSTFVAKINVLCSLEADKGNVHFILQEAHFVEFGLVINEQNFKTLEYFLKQEDYTVISHKKTMEITWVHLICKPDVSADKISPLPATATLQSNIPERSVPNIGTQSEIKVDNLDSFIEKYSVENVQDINIMSVFLKEKLVEQEIKTNKSAKEQNSIQMFCTLLKVEKQFPEKNNKIFASPKFLDAVIKKLDELIEVEKLFWPVELKEAFLKIKANRFPTV